MQICSAGSAAVAWLPTAPCAHSPAEGNKQQGDAKLLSQSSGVWTSDSLLHDDSIWRRRHTHTHTRDKLLREAVRDCEVSSCTQERPCSAPAVSRRYKTHVMGQLPSEICTEQSSRSNVKNQIPESPWNQTIQCNEAAPFPSPFFSPCALKRKEKQKENSVCISLVLLLPLYCTVAACVSHLAACQSRAQVCCRKYYSQVGLLSL